MRRQPNLVLLGILALAIALLPPVLRAEGLPIEPLLRLETGMHTGPIKRISVDQAGDLLVTASDDKTLRLWNLDDGSLLKTLRGPIGEGEEGRLYAVALSPNGQWIAAGGATKAGSEGPGNYHIYLFDQASGELRQTLFGLPNVINHLCFSQDGRYLAASLGSDGIRIWMTDGWRPVASDTDYGDASHWCDFSAKGQLVTSSLDGQIRLYDSQFKLLAKRAAPGGKEPFAVVFSPDGARIAVGFADAPVVNLLSGKDLQPLDHPSRKGIDNGDLSKVAWSSDGQHLFAGGRFQLDGKFPIVAWEKAGKGERRFWKATGNSLVDLRPLANGELLAATNDPAWLRFNHDGELIKQRRAVIPDLRNKLGEHFRVSADGRRIAVCLGYGGEHAVMIDINAKRLFEGQINETWLLQQRLVESGYDPGGIDGQAGPQLKVALNQWRQAQGMGPGSLDDAVRRGLGITPLAAPRVKAEGIKVSDWENKPGPKLNGKALPLAPHETSRALAIAPDGQGFLLGTSWYLRRFDRQGQPVWQTQVPDTVWGVNISADGRLAVAALGDGTVRWYRYADGQELLALFVHRETREWVLWSPDGYYDASPGGDRLIGWHLNRVETGEGLTVLNVVPGSAAARAGVLPGDQIESVNGVRVKTREELIEVINQTPAGEPLHANIIRGLEYLAFEVWPQRQDAKAPPKVGTLVGRAMTQANTSDFYPVSSFRERFYRPQVVANILETLDEGKAIAKANTQGERTQPEQKVAASLPPLVQILSPRDGDSFGQGQTTVRYRIKNPSGESIRLLQVLVDGRPLDTQRGLQRITKQEEAKPAASGEETVEISLPTRDLTLSLVAENRYGASPPETIRLRWEGPQQEGFVVQPKLYALAAGVSDYANDSVSDLTYAAKDAKDFGAALERQSGGLYREVVVHILENPTNDELLDGLDWLRREVTSKDIAVLFVSGHGANDPDGDYYYLTKDSDPERLRRTAVSSFEVKKTLSALPSKVLAFVDTCHSGNIMGSRREVANITGVINDLTSAENGVVVFASSTGKQYSLENSDWGNGAFTKALVEGIDGAANYTKDGRITINQLDLYLSERVKTLTGNKQTPTTTKPQTITDFPIAVKR
jgi:WD40 repeat protein